jgi:hypothetical protein
LCDQQLRPAQQEYYRENTISLQLEPTPPIDCRMI